MKRKPIQSEIAMRNMLTSPANQPPDTSRASSSRPILFPANHEMVEIRILFVIDRNRDPVNIVITKIMQDEPVDGLGIWDTAPDGGGIGTNTAQVRSSFAPALIVWNFDYQWI